MGLYRIVNILLIALAVVCISQSDFQSCKDCGDVFTSRQTIITSPKYPDNYPSGICCDYIFRSSFRCRTNYHIQFLDFSLEASVNCVNDFLAIGNVVDHVVDVRDYTGDILCGRVTGIRKVRSDDGMLRVRFVTNDVAEERGFRLLITRLSCEDTPTHNITYQTIQSDKHKDSNTVVNLPNLQLLPPILTDTTKQVNNYQGEQYLPPSEGYLPNNSSYPTLPWPPTSNGYLPPPCIRGNKFNPQADNYPEQLPAGLCCAGNFRQRRFYLTSPGFPGRADWSQPRDCYYYIEKSGPNVCRLRMVFRFFALGSVNIYSEECLNDFIEIDGERICGCRTGFVYTREWGLGARVIHLKTYGRQSGSASSGFLLDVTQEECGVRYSRQVSDDERRQKLKPHAIVETNSTTRTTFYLHDSIREHSPNKAVNSKLFFSQKDSCKFGFLDFWRISFDPLWLTRLRC